MKCFTCLFGFCVLFLINFVFAANSCESQISNESVPASYPARSLIYDGEISKCECKNKTTICVRKCCAVNYSYDYENETCVYDGRNLLEVPAYTNNTEVNFHFVPGMMKCFNEGKDAYLEFLLDMILFFVKTDGRLLVPKIDNMTFDDYCIDAISEYGFVFALACDSAVPYTISDRISFIGMVISLPFLFVTFVVYALLPNRNLHGSALMCYVSAFFGACLCLIVPYLAPYVVIGSLRACRVVGILSFYLFMASICWMNVMSFDIWSTFSGSRGYAGIRKRTQWRRFGLYSLYAWGFPLLQLGIIFLVSHTAPRKAWYNPHMIGDDCWIRDGVPELLYMYGPMAILITANIVLFGITACKIRGVQKDTAMLTKRGSKKHSSGDDDKIRFKLYIKLLFGMGINWSMEIIMWAINWQVKNIPPAVWYLADFCNAAFGVFIFFIFVFNKSVWRGLKKRYYMMTGKTPIDSQTSTSITAASSLVRH